MAGGVAVLYNSSLRTSGDTTFVNNTAFVTGGCIAFIASSAVTLGDRTTFEGDGRLLRLPVVCVRCLPRLLGVVRRRNQPRIQFLRVRRCAAHSDRTCIVREQPSDCRRRCESLSSRRVFHLDGSFTEMSGALGVISGHASNSVTLWFDGDDIVMSGNQAGGSGGAVYFAKQGTITGACVVVVNFVA